MTTREKFKRRVIELIHGLPYEEAVKKEPRWLVSNLCRNCGTECSTKHYEEGNNTWCETCEHQERTAPHYICAPHPITLSRVMQALPNTCSITASGAVYEVCSFGTFTKPETKIKSLGIVWQLTTKDGATATDEDQSDETIEALYKLIK